MEPETGSLLEIRRIARHFGLLTPRACGDARCGWITSLRGRPRLYPRAHAIVPDRTFVASTDGQSARIIWQEPLFAITPDPFIMFTSNIVAILGPRAL